ncbi:hypothetical protein H6G33_07955 [Calothrix sp. FACHB-1219]|uniref:hypothetical protein n=1 Tax=unclassified Calothrix TaxID=2619626 RepID=UPI0016884E52|nr:MULTISPECIES: hypothetical protein [unclassified Calothrix]MBD2201926.1 hypothetical protein [Calothrix sp. FACHB-168]MBD2216962.1 hypothetical protein [Calothrix sp. FACHB-1219]
MITFGFKYFTAACTAILLASTHHLPDPAIASVNNQSQQIAQNQAQTTNSEPNLVFRPILAKIKQKSRIRILLPKFIPESDGVTKIYAIVESATRNKYEILLGFSPDCNGGTACRLGVVTAEAVTRKTPSLTGKTVTLARGIRGYFVDATCGANCSDATLTWRQRGVQYTVGLKAGDRASLIKMANSAINP